ncbi:MAG: zinc-dependent metalloprotease [Burkholderiaceae bacterium]
MTTHRIVPPVVPRARSAVLAVALTATLVVAGCATSKGATGSASATRTPATAASGAPVGRPPGAAGGAPAAAGAAAPAAAAGSRPDNATLKPFREIVAGATELDGLFPLWQKEDKVWIEIPVERLDQPFFFSYNVSDSVGERGAYASQMGRRHMVVFHRIGNAMQLIAKNTRFIATAGSPTERAVRQSFSDSLLGSAPVLSQPHLERRSVLIDASAFLMTDIPGYSTTLESAFRINYTLDRANSSFVKIRADERSASFSVRDHFSTARLPGITPVNPLALVPPISPPNTPPDARSVFIGFVYTLMALPQPMQPRYADDRVGTFTTTIADYTTDSAPNARKFLVNRWRLEKRDPTAAMSDPKEPIVFWVDRNVPVDYRDTIVEGILAWNKAFERIGYSNAIVAKIQPDDADFDTLDARHASVRWYLGADAGFAIGPSHTDPRTGEILDADIAIPDLFTRNAKTLVSEALPEPKSHEGTAASAESAFACDFASEAVGEAAFALGLLDARGEVPADSAEADRFARDYLRGVVTHEVGHTLGLRHNFHASTIRTPAQLQDAAFTRANGLTGSVMDYTPFNIATHDEHQGEYVMSGLGPYDYWAIEYAYKTIDAATSDAERPELSRIAARSTEPALTFATDEDADAGPDGMDPEVNRFDLGSDPLVYYRKRFALSRELWDRLQSRPMASDQSYLVVRRNFERGFNEIGRAAPLIAKYVGGVKTSRNHVALVATPQNVSLDSGGALYVPVDAARQKQALDLLATQLFSIDSFRFKPAFIGRLGVDYLDRSDPNGSNKTAFYLPGRVLAIQTGALDHLMSDPVARRIGDAENMSERPRDLLTLSQLYGSLQNAIWSELASGKEITRMRRNLQREHLRRMLAVLLRPGSATLADQRSLQRDNAIALRASIQRTLAASRLSGESRAHLRESSATIDDVLKASMLRIGT